MDVQPNELQVRLSRAGNYLTVGTLYWVAAIQTLRGVPVTVDPESSTK